jgi:Zn ribbon nucleic-acid-binding protein
MLYQHPKTTDPCPDCGEIDWVATRIEPIVGQIYGCLECGHQVFVYDIALDGDESNYRLRTLDNNLAREIVFEETTGQQWADLRLHYRRLGLRDHEAMDYHACEVCGLTNDEWATLITTLSESAVNNNVRLAKVKLEPFEAPDEDD